MTDTNRLTIEAGWDADAQEANFMNSTLQSNPDRTVAYSIACFVETTETTEDEVVNQLKAKLEAVVEAVDGISFEVAVGPETSH